MVTWRAGVAIGFMLQFGFLGLALARHLPGQRQEVGPTEPEGAEAAPPTLVVRSGTGEVGLELAVMLLQSARPLSASRGGYAGVRSTMVLAWRVIAASEVADSIFEALIISATAPGKLYALAGLYGMDSDRFNRYAEWLAGMPGMVTTVRGCVVRERSIRATVMEIANGEWSMDFYGLGRHLS